MTKDYEKIRDTYEEKPIDLKRVVRPCQVCGTKVHTLILRLVMREFPSTDECTIECPVCGASTEKMAPMAEAVERWNSGSVALMEKPNERRPASAPAAGKASRNMMRKSDFELLFTDSPEYFLVRNAKMVFERGMVRFICFDGDEFSHDEWYPARNVFRIRRYDGGHK